MFIFNIWFSYSLINPLTSASVYLCSFISSATAHAAQTALMLFKTVVSICYFYQNHSCIINNNHHFYFSLIIFIKKYGLVIKIISLLSVQRLFRFIDPWRMHFDSLHASNDVQWLVCIILFICKTLFMRKFGNRRVKLFLKHTLFKLGCLCKSVWDVAFNDETFFVIKLSKIR